MWRHERGWHEVYSDHTISLLNLLGILLNRLEGGFTGRRVLYRLLRV